MCVPAIVSIIIVLSIVTCFLCTHIYTKIIQNNVYNVYSKLDAYLVKRYELVSVIINELKQKKSLFNAEKILYLRDEALSLRNNNKNIDRRAAFDGELASKMSELIDTLKADLNISSDSALNANIQKYNDLDIYINRISKQYNKAAKKLKIVTEVFPSSFVTRFNGIKSIDLYIEV